MKTVEGRWRAAIAQAPSETLRATVMGELKMWRRDKETYRIAVSIACHAAVTHVRRAHYATMPAQLLRLIPQPTHPGWRYHHCGHCMLSGVMQAYDSYAAPVLGDLRGFLHDIDAGLTRHMPAAVKLISTASEGMLSSLCAVMLTEADGRADEAHSGQPQCAAAPAANQCHRVHHGDI